MKKVALLVALAFTVVIAAAPAAAAPPIEVEGTWSYVLTGGGIYKVAGPDKDFFGGNAFFEGTDDGTWKANEGAVGFEGTSEEEYVAVFHKKHGTYQGLMTFTGEVDGKKGTLIIKTNGSGPFPPTGDWTGRWVILSGTGELANLHGSGSWWGPLGNLQYKGKVHFSP